MEDIYETTMKEINEAVEDNTKLLFSHMHSVATDAYLKGYRRGVKNITNIFGRLYKYNDFELHEIFFGDDDTVVITADPISIINKFDLKSINSILDKHEAKNRKE